MSSEASKILEMLKKNHWLANYSEFREGQPPVGVWTDSGFLSSDLEILRLNINV